MAKTAKKNLALKKSKRKSSKKTRKQSYKKRSVKSKKSRKMAGGSLIGTDLVTGVNTSNNNDVFAFGTTGGSEYIASTIMGEPIESNLITASQDKMVPMV